MNKIQISSNSTWGPPKEKADKPCPLWTWKQKLLFLAQVLKMPTDLVPGESPVPGLQTAAFLVCLHAETRRTLTTLSKVENLILGRKSCQAVVDNKPQMCADAQPANQRSLQEDQRFNTQQNVLSLTYISLGSKSSLSYPYASKG